MDYELDETFRITDDKLADWAIRKIKGEEEEKERLIGLANQQIADLQAKIEDLNKYYDNKTGFLKSCLQQYFDTVPHKETKTQETYKLLSGSLVFKKPSTKIIYDENNLLVYLKESGDKTFIKTKESVNWADFKKDLAINNDGMVVDTATGEILDAKVCTTENVPPTFNIKF